MKILGRAKDWLTRGRSRGQATVELAIVFVFLLLPVLIGIADLGRILSEQLAVVNAARVGARWVTLTGAQQNCTGYGAVATVVANDLANAHVQVQSVTIAASAPTTGPIVQINVAYSHRVLFGIGGTANFQASAAMPGVPATPDAAATCPPVATVGTAVPSATATATLTNTPVPTNTYTPTNSPTATNTSTSTATNTPTITPIPPTATRTNTLTATPSFTPSITPTTGPTFTPTRTPTVPTPTRTNTSIPPTSTSTTTPTITNTPTATPTSCPYIVTFTGFKQTGNRPLNVSVTVTNQQGQPVSGVNVTVISGSDSVTSATNAAGHICLSPGSYGGASVNFTVSVAAGLCSPYGPVSGTSTTTPNGCP